MRILLVEDEIFAREEFEELLFRALPATELLHASSRDSAMDLIREGGLDAVVCDLKISPSDGSLAADESHGMSVVERLRSSQPGTPLTVLTGHGTLENFRQALRGAPVVDIYGGVELEMVKCLKKDEIRLCIEHLTVINGELERLASILVEDAGGTTPVSEMLGRALRVYATRVGAVSCHVDFAGGLSGAETAIVRFRDERGGEVARAFAKMQRREKAEAELAKSMEVPATMPIGTFAPSAGDVLFGLRSQGALFFSLADEYTGSIMSSGGATPAGEMLRNLLAATGRWRLSATSERTNIRDLRRTFITDSELLSHKDKLDRALRLEELSIDMLVCRQHGDLHGENVLVSQSGEVVLIDFADLGSAPAVLDLVALEWGFVFHPRRPIAERWPTDEQLEQWFDLDVYLVDCPVAELIRGIRAAAESIDSAALPAVVYCHAVRQLKYDDVPKGKAVAVAKGSATYAEALGQI